MKTNKHFRLSDEAVRILDELSTKTGKTQTQIIEEALKIYQTKEYEENTAIELLTKENEKLKLIINTLQLTLQEKDKKYEDMRNTYEHMINNIKKNYEDMKANYD
ncbi:MAG: ribbon-helix-helix protein, CopG family, partial [Nanopusillaceae archaeon]